MFNQRYYIEKEKYDRPIARKNIKSDFYNGIYDRWEYPVLTNEHIPLTWKYDLNPETNPYFMERQENFKQKIFSAPWPLLSSHSVMCICNMH